jgi:2-dehydropantoate 2-reductase
VKFAIVGAGAIGAFVGASLAHAGEDVTLVARGEHLRAMRASGVCVRSAQGDFIARPTVTDDIASIGPVDVVVLSLKAHQIGAVAGALPMLFDANTTVVAMQNGMPWWYFERHGGPYDGWSLESVDPGGRIAAAIASERVIGCVVYAATAIEAPGVIRNLEARRFRLGELDRTIGERIRRLSATFVDAGLEAPIDVDLRAELWLKMLGNTSFNPISALTRATLVDMAEDPLASDLARDVMAECVAIATRLGVTLSATIDERLDVARRVGAHKTSMLQDLEAGRPMEIEAVVGSVAELGARLEIPTPATSHVYALVKLLARTKTTSSL